MSMSGYTKLFSSILASTIWREDDKTRIVWITLLAMADKNGVAEGSVPGLADFARVSVDDCRAAIEKLSSPDIDSRTPDFDGRRIKAVDGGWQLLNHAKYRAKLNADERREYLRQKQAEFRAKPKIKQACQQVSTSVNNGQQVSTLSTQAEAKADTKAEADLFIGDSKESPPSSGPAIAWTQAEGFQGITDADKQSWAIAYPACDLTRQLAAMNEWLRANPTKAHKKAWRRFIIGWLERAQERGGDAKSSPVSHQTKKTTINDYDRPSTWTEEQNAI